jgi:lysophospholipase L1-like esterase
MKIVNHFNWLVVLSFLMIHALIAQDWANLNRFKEENKMAGEPKQNENRVVFMGNSITQMWAEVDSVFFANKSYINRGISGQTTPQMLLRFRQDVIKLKPKIVVILAGTNDIAGNTGPSTLEMIEDNIAGMAELARVNGIKVILCSVLPAFDYPWAPGKNPVEKIPTLNDWIRQYAEKNGQIYVDYYSPMVDENGGLKKEFSEDGVHPNFAGYAVMVPIIEQALKEALK